MDRKSSLLTIESAGYYSLAFMSTQLFHELAHALTGRFLGSQPILHTGFVEHTADISTASRVLIAAAGPLFSLLQGLLLLWLVRKGPAHPRLRLFGVWMSFHGMVNFVGYVFSTSFALSADLGRIAVLLQLPMPVRVALTGLGYVGLRYVVRPLAPAFAALCAHPLPAAVAARAFAHELGLYAGALATPILIVAALPVPHWLSLVYAICAFLPLFDLPKALAKNRNFAESTPLRGSRPLFPFTAYILLVVLARYCLDRGVPLW